MADLCTVFFFLILWCYQCFFLAMHLSWKGAWRLSTVCFGVCLVLFTWTLTMGHAAVFWPVFAIFCCILDIFWGAFFQCFVAFWSAGSTQSGFLNNIFFINFPCYASKENTSERKMDNSTSAKVEQYLNDQKWMVGSNQAIFWDYVRGDNRRGFGPHGRTLWWLCVCVCGRGRGGRRATQAHTDTHKHNRDLRCREGQKKSLSAW